MGQQDLQQGTGEGDNLDAAVRQMRELVDGEFGVGTLATLGNGWQSVFLGHSATREQDLEILAARLHFPPYNRDPSKRARLLAHYHAALRERGNDMRVGPNEARTHYAAIGLWEARDNVTQPCRIKVAKGAPRREELWSCDAGGLIAPVVIDHLPSRLVRQRPGEWVKGNGPKTVQLTPRNLSLTGRFLWYRNAAKRYARAALKSEAMGKDSALNAAAGQEDEAPSRLDSLVAAEAADEGIRSLFAAASPRQEQILLGLLDRFREGLSEPEARAAVARDLGVSPSTVNVQLHRIRHRV